MKDAKIFDGAAWHSLRGPSGPEGPSTPSADAGNTLALGTDALLFTTAPPDSDSHVWCRSGDNIAEKYEQAKALTTPGGVARSATNRVSLLVLPGVYDLGTYFDENYGDYLPVVLVLDTPFVDVVGLGSASLPLGCSPAVIVPQGVSVTASGLRVSGISAGDLPFTGVATDCVIENCAGGEYSFGFRSEFSNCSGGNYSFQGDSTCSNCVGGEYAFFEFASGTFTNCKGGGYSFGGSVVASGHFTNCEGGYGSFGADGLASGVFTNCKGGELSFGGRGEASGSFVNCTGGRDAFGGSGVASGNFQNCIGGLSSFGGSYSNDENAEIAASARLVGCRVTLRTFDTPKAGAILRYCLDENFNEVNTP